MTDRVLRIAGARLALALLMCSSVLAPRTSGAAWPATTVPPAVSEPPSTIRLHGRVQDRSGSPVPSAMWVLDERGQPVGDLPTDEQGSYDLTVAWSDRLSISAGPFAAIQMDGYQYARYFELTRAIVPSSEIVELDFVVPSTAILSLDAYDPRGDWLGFDAFNEAINPSGFYGYQGVYGVFPLADLPLPIPTQASVGLFRAASHPETDRAQWLPYFSVPPGEAVFLMLPWEVPGAGTFPLRADNGGEGFSLSEGEVVTINLVYELAETEYRRTVELRSSYTAQGEEFSAAVIDGLMLAAESLAAARGETDEAQRAIDSYEVLRQSILARESMTLEAAGRGIATRKDELTVVVQDAAGDPVPGAGVSLRQTHADFVLGQFGELPLYAYLPATYKACKEIGFEYLFRIDYWSRVSPARGVYDFSEVDRGLERARVEGWDAVAGLAWLGPDNVPTWAENLEFSEFKQSLREVVKAYVGHLDGKVKYLHVAMEPTIQTIVGSRYVDVELESGYSTGVQYAELVELVRTVFEAAREVDSDILLGYTVDSDYGYARLNPSSFGAWPCPYSFLKSVLEAGVSPDYIGLSLYPALGALPLDLSTVAADIQAYHDLSGLPVMIVEMTSYPSRTEDYGLTGPVPNYYWHEHMTRQAQTDWDTSVFKIAMGLPYVFGLMMTHGGPDYPGWEPGQGVTDCVGIPGCYSIGADFLNQDYERKPVYYALRDLFDSWRGQGSAETDPDGKVSFAGLAGDYTIGVTTTGGLLQTFAAHLGPGSGLVTVTLDADKALGDLQSLMAEAQQAVDWSRGLGRELDYSSLRSRLAQARSALSEGDYGRARAAALWILDAVALRIDGDPADWLGIPPMATLPPGGVQVDAPGLDLKAVYGMTDEEYLYLMLEVYDPPIRMQPDGIDPGDVRYPIFGFILKVDGAADPTHSAGTYLPYGGQIELYEAAGGGRILACLYSMAYGQALELKIPIALLGNVSRIGVVPYVVAEKDGVQVGAKGFYDYADVLHPVYTVHVPLVGGR